MHSVIHHLLHINSYMFRHRHAILRESLQQRYKNNQELATVVAYVTYFNI